MFAVFSVAMLGCIGDPDRVGRTVASDAPPVPTAVWQQANAGCEGFERSGLAIAPVEGEPLLGALVDPEGAVACVDALSLIAIERDAYLGIDPLAGDPSPQPAIQYISGTARMIAPSVHPDLDAPGSRDIVLVPKQPARVDPTPTPVTEE